MDTRDMPHGARHSGPAVADLPQRVAAVPGGVQQDRPLADDFFLMVNDEGRPKLHPRIFGLGVAAALLGELAFRNVIWIEDGRLILLGLPSSIDDGLAAEIHAQVVAEGRGLPVRDWLDYLAGTAADRVGERLAAADVMVRTPPRVPVLGRADRWVPTDWETARRPAIDVGLKLHNQKADLHHLALFGLTAATGLNHPLLYSARGRLSDPAALKQTLAPLDARPVLRHLIDDAKDAVANAVASRRRI